MLDILIFILILGHSATNIVMRDLVSPDPTRPVRAETLVLPIEEKTGLAPSDEKANKKEPGIPCSRLASRPRVLENHSRSVLKAISWRATGTLDTMVISFLVTGRLKVALSIGFVELFTKVGLYYVHERAWNKIQFGRVKSTEDYQI